MKRINFAVLSAVGCVAAIPTFAASAESIEIFPATPISVTCANPQSGAYFYNKLTSAGTCSVANNYAALWTFAEKTVTLKCRSIDTAVLTAAGDPNDDGTGVIVDNLMTVNGTNPCGSTSNANCFTSGSSATIGVPIQQTFNGVGTLNIRGLIPDDVSDVTFALKDWGAVYGNSRIVLETTCSTGPTPVVVNVHPNSDPNPLNLGSGGTTPVAILGTADFDVTEIDLDTLTLSNATVRVVGKSDRQLCSYEDVGSYDEVAFDKLGAYDGVTDLVCHFVTSEIVPQDAGDTFTVTVKGMLTDGFTEFEGSDIVKVVKQ